MTSWLCMRLHYVPCTSPFSRSPFKHDYPHAQRNVERPLFCSDTMFKSWTCTLPCVKNCWIHSFCKWESTPKIAIYHVLQSPNLGFANFCNFLIKTTLDNLCFQIIGYLCKDSICILPACRTITLEHVEHWKNFLYAAQSSLHTANSTRPTHSCNFCTHAASSATE